MLEDTLGSTSFNTTLKEEPDNQEDYGYTEYPDTSDEETELVDLKSQTEGELSSLREDVAAWAVETKQTHSSVNKRSH
ncbi:Hypothetical predicted protein [Xyrichtys novacula]|uniref:Uncharacterized protein n=1 Tax=Xyrichtys novacula TaxID=13765 RepID=A0AAV1FLH4_XYRNO|nr:Hypothetical predicted protein [Xyrichtys novacula]